MPRQKTIKVKKNKTVEKKEVADQKVVIEEKDTTEQNKPTQKKQTKLQVKLVPRAASINTIKDINKAKENFEKMCASHPFCTMCNYTEEHTKYNCFLKWIAENVDAK